MRFRLLFAFGLSLCSCLLAAPAWAEDPLPAPTTPLPPATDLPPPSAKVNLIIAGAATTLVSYGLALSASYLAAPEDLNGAKDLRIPIAGPWIMLGKTGCPASNVDCNKAPLVIGAVLSIFDGVAQAGGLAILGEGLFLSTSSKRPAPRKAEGPTLRAVPFSFDRGGAGLGVVGTF